MEAPKEVVIITGSSGFIGSALAERLKRKYQIVGLDRGEPPYKLEGVDYHSVNMSSSEEIEKCLISVKETHGSRIASVVHLVAYYSFDGKQSPRYQEITVNGTDFLLNNLRKHFEVGQFIFSSTMLVHESGSPGDEITEDSPVTPSWAYPASKVAAEKVLRENHEDVPVVNLRIAGVYEDNCHSIPISQHIARIYECQLTSFFFPGDANHGQTFLHLEDLIDAIELCIEKRNHLPSVTTLLLGEDDVLPYKELQGYIGQLVHDIRWPTIRIPQFVATSGAYVLGKLPFVRDPFIKPWMIPFADDHYDLNINRARHLLNWEPKKNMKEALPLMVQGLKENPEAWYKHNKIERPPLRSIKVLTESEQRQYWAMAIFNIFLGMWIISNPFTLGSMSKSEFWNDIISGFLVILVSALSLLPALRNLRWVNALIGTWLMFAPLAFWSKSAAVYSNETLIGGLILLFAAFTPSAKDDKLEVPSGWSYNPSSWIQRLPIMTLAFLGFLLARYLAAFQLGHIPEVWDPFFGDGSAKILRSDVSKAFPVSDGGLGAMSYLMDVIAAAIGDRNRWRTMPWMVILFGLFIVPTGVTSITLIMLQPIAVNAWCTICLITAVIMLIMVPPAVDEVVATVQFLRRSVKSGQPFWQTFWLGGADVLEQKEFVPAESAASGSRMSVILCCLLGAGLLFIPDLLGIRDLAANFLYIIGALVVTFAVIAYADVARIVRLVNFPLGIFLCLLPWFFDDVTISSRLIVFAFGLAIALLSIPRGKVVQHFGSFDPWVHFHLPELFQWISKRRQIG